MNDLVIYHIKDELRLFLNLSKENSILGSEIHEKQTKLNVNKDLIEKLRIKMGNQ